jgi:methionine-rich copper-binding protein CopC
MKRLLLFTVALLAWSPPAVLAQHNHGAPESSHTSHGEAQAQMLASSTPRDGAVLARAPQTLSLTFVHPVALQTVVVTGPGSARVPATFRRASSPTATYSVAFPALAAGAYEARWTASGGGHAMNGVIRFIIQ